MSLNLKHFAVLKNFFTVACRLCGIEINCGSLAEA